MDDPLNLLRDKGRFSAGQSQMLDMAHLPEQAFQNAGAYGFVLRFAAHTVCAAHIALAGEFQDQPFERYQHTIPPFRFIPLF